MNGRMYDAKLGRFLSPNNFVQDPYNTQNFNRYGYVLNNPLMYSDPSGEFVWAAVIIGAIINMTVAAIQGKSFGQVMLAGVIGAVTGMIAGGIGNLVAGGAFFSNAAMGVVGFAAGATVGAATGLAGGFTSGMLNTFANGGNFSDAITAGIKAGISGAFIGAAVGGITGGIRARKMDLGFWEMQGLM